MNPLGLLTFGCVSIPNVIIQRLEALIKNLPLSPEAAQSLLVKALELPLPPSMTEALGIFQSDLVIRTAIIAAIADIRANPWLLDYIFASLPRDALTMSEYGEKEVQVAKDWFLKTNIKVAMNLNVNEVKFPCISIALMSSNEDSTTLGDIHYVTQEDNDVEWPALAGPFSPLAYHIVTGIMKLPTSVTDNLVVSAGMVLIAKNGNQYDILEVADGGESITIAANVIDDFGSCVIKGKRPTLITTLESAIYREVYMLGCHTNGEAWQLTVLHSILVFILLRYKQALLEARGLERTTINSTDAKPNEYFSDQMVYSRYCQITGFVRQSWPKAIYEKVTSLALNLDVDQATFSTLSGLDGDMLTFDGTINIDSDTGPAGPAGKAGPPGPAGPQGDPGEDATLPDFGEDGSVIYQEGDGSPGTEWVAHLLTEDDIAPGFAITSFSPGFSTTLEIGDLLNDPGFTASYNRPPEAVTITDSISTIDPGSPFTSFAYGSGLLPSRSYNETLTWTLSANETGGPTETATITASFLPRVFYDVEVPDTIDETFIEALAGQTLASGFARTIAYSDAGGTKKLYYAFPTSFGTPSQFKDADTGFSIPFSLVGSAISITNDFAVAIDYDIWASDNILTGAFNVVVS